MAELMLSSWLLVPLVAGEEAGMLQVIPLPWGEAAGAEGKLLVFAGRCC